jgi:integrase
MGVKVRQKGGKWYVFINYNGQRKAKCVGDKRAAEQVRRKLEAKLTLGEFKLEDKAPLPTFGAYAERWLRTYAHIHCRETTAKNYQGLLRHHVFPTIGHESLGAVTREDIKEIIAVMVTKGLSKSTVANTIAPVKEMLNHAVVDDGVLSGNPAARIGRFLRRTKDRRVDVNPLTSEEVASLLDATQQHVPQYYPLLLCAVRTGMRMGELLGLQWGDIDFHSRFIEVHRAIVWGKVVPTKSGKIRRVDMSQQLTDSLKKLWVRRKEETLQKGWSEVPAWIFVNEEGRLLDPNNVRKRVLYRCLEKAGIRRVRFHDLRHTFASLLIAQNESPKKIQSLLGHHSIQVTMDIYGHLYAEENRKVVDSLDDVPDKEGSTTKRNPRATRLSSATGTHGITY